VTELRGQQCEPPDAAARHSGDRLLSSRSEIFGSTRLNRGSRPRSGRWDLMVPGDSAVRQQGEPVVAKASESVAATPDGGDVAAGVANLDAGQWARPLLAMRYPALRRSTRRIPYRGSPRPAMTRALLFDAARHIVGGREAQAHHMKTSKTRTACGTGSAGLIRSRGAD